MRLADTYRCVGVSDLLARAPISHLDEFQHDGWHFAADGGQHSKRVDVCAASGVHVIIGCAGVCVLDITTRWCQCCSTASLHGDVFILFHARVVVVPRGARRRHGTMVVLRIQLLLSAVR